MLAAGICQQAAGIRDEAKTISRKSQGLRRVAIRHQESVLWQCGRKAIGDVQHAVDSGKQMVIVQVKQLIAASTAVE